MKPSVIVWGFVVAGCSPAVQVAQDMGVPIRDAPGVEYGARLADADRGVVLFASTPAGEPREAFRPDEPIHAYVSMEVPLVFWEKKFCQQVSCDYDHGELNLTLYIDGIEVKFSSAEFWMKDWQEVHPTALFTWTGAADNTTTSRTQGRLERGFAAALPGLAPGRHEVAIHVWKDGHADDILVAGAFALDVP